METAEIEPELKAYYKSAAFGWKAGDDKEIAMADEVIWATSQEDLVNQITQNLEDLPDNFTWDYSEGTLSKISIKYWGTNQHELEAQSELHPDTLIYHKIPGVCNPLIGSIKINLAKSKRTISRRRARMIARGELHHSDRVALVRMLQAAIQKKLNRYKDILNIRVKWTGMEYLQPSRSWVGGSYCEITADYSEWSATTRTFIPKKRDKHYFSMIPELFWIAKDQCPKSDWRRLKHATTVDHYRKLELDSCPWRQLMKDLKPAIKIMKADPVKRKLGLLLERECREMKI